ncbi:MAG: leucine-rich repeat protein [Clostridia bacterium]|nr:leucine-rich repeat protein [Clostridia bacterium]
MKKRFLRSVCAMLAACLMLWALPTVSFAETSWYLDENFEIQTFGDWQYIVVDPELFPEVESYGGGARIVGYTGTAPAVTIPDTLDGHPVYSIGEDAFKENDAVSSVFVSDMVRVIEESAFEKCSGLQTVMVTLNLSEIGESAFEECAALKTVQFESGSALRTIGAYAFDECAALSNFIIPDGVETIGDYAFRDCDSLPGIVIPNSVTSLGEGCFYLCDNLESAVIGDGVPELRSGYYYDRYRGCFEECISLSEVTIGSGVRTIGKKCFMKTALTEVDIPDCVREIENSAFEDCDSLTDIRIGKSVYRIGDCAFWDCDSLKTITIPTNVFELGEGCFYSCDSLESAVIGNGVSELPAKWYFKDCGCFGECVSLSEVSLGSGIRTIGDACFSGTALREINIHDGVRAIGDGAFENCVTLEKAVIGDKVKEIGDSAFNNCASLTDLTFGKEVTSIGTAAFRDCDSLKDVRVPSSVTMLGGGCFYDCDSLESAVIGNGATELSGFTEYYTRGCFGDCAELKSVTIGSGLLEIGSNSFTGTQVSSITVPAKVSTLGDGAFSDAGSLEDIYFMSNYPVNVGSEVYDSVPEELVIHYIDGKNGYDDVGFNKATFEPITVNFDNNMGGSFFGSITDDQLIADVGGYVIEPIDPIAKKYVFSGWFEDSDCTLPWDFSGTFVTEDTTIYAKWIPTDSIPPLAVEDLSVTGETDKTIDISWTGVEGADGYNVYVDGEIVNSELAGGTTYTLTGLSADTTYEITVAGVNSVGEGEESLILAARTLLPIVPEKVTDVRLDGEATSSSVTVVWEPVDGADGYNIYVDGEIVNEELITEPGYTVTGLEPSTDYEIAVSAESDVGEGERSDPVDVTTAPGPEFIYGDVDGDGDVLPADARLTLRYSVNLEELSETAVLAADVDLDSDVTPADARLILRYCVALEAELPVAE